MELHVISPHPASPDQNLPQGIKNLCPRDPRYPIHSKARNVFTCQFLHHLCILRRIQERDNGRARPQLVYLGQRTIEAWCPNSKQYIAFRKHRLRIRQCDARLLICLVRELGLSTSSTLHQDLLEPLLEKQSCILWCDSYTSLVRV